MVERLVRVTGALVRSKGHGLGARELATVPGLSGSTSRRILEILIQEISRLPPPPELAGASNIYFEK